MTARPIARLAAALLALLLASPAAAGPLDRIARDYVALTLEAGTHEAEYVDAYYGPPAWAAAAKAHPRSVPRLRAEAERLAAQARAVDPAALSPIERLRRAFLLGQLRAADTRLAMIAGQRLSFADEAEGLFGVRPVLRPLADFDPLLARVEALVPGQGPLWRRVDAYKERFAIPADRLEPVMRAAIAECRRRTLAHIALPADESFTLEFVTGKPWSGYNYYQGGDRSLIQVNTDLPVLIDRAVDLGCHEGYPGHHTYNVLLEEGLVKGRGWAEFSVYPLYSPQSFIAEGSANYGIELAFPGTERAAFEAAVLYPLAGLDPAEAPRYAALNEALRELGGARFTIAAEFLDGRIDRTEAMRLTQRYQLLSEARAAKSLDFADHYRSYVINYGLGRDRVAQAIERRPPGDPRWLAMARLLSQPIGPDELDEL